MANRLEIAEFLLIAEEVLSTPAEQLARFTRLPAAEAALAAPFARLGEVAFYPDPVERAAICCARIVRNNPLPDGNKRVGYECMRELLERAGVAWPPARGEDAAEVARMVEGLAARTLPEADFVRWAKARAKL